MHCFQFVLTLFVLLLFYSLCVQVSYDRTTISLSVNVTKPGNVYCTAQRYGSPKPLSVLDIQQSSLVARTIALEAYKNVSLQLTGLLPATKYSVYCFSDDFSTHPMSLSEALASNTTVTTACCREVRIGNIPNNIVQYFPLNNRPENVFTVSLGSYPPSSATVTLSLKQFKCTPNAGTILTNDLAVLPSSFVFTSSSVTLSDTFIIRGTTLGCFTLTASVKSSVYYKPFNTTINMFSYRSSPTVPVLQSIQMSNAGTSLVFKFDTATDKGASTVTAYNAIFPCAQLVTFTGSSSASTVCKWLDSFSLEASYATSTAKPVVGESATLLGGKVKAECVPSTVCNTYVAVSTISKSILAPAAPVVPTPVLKTLEVIAICDDILLDPTGTTGSGGRAWKSAVWSVTAQGLPVLPGGKGTAKIESFLNQYFATPESVARVPNAMLNASDLYTTSTYTFSLTITNFLLQTAVVKKTVLVSNGVGTAIPNLLLFGADVATFRWKPVNILAVANFPGCVQNPSSLPFYFSWKVYDGLTYLPSITSVSSNQRNFRLNPYALDSSKIYTVSVDVAYAYGGVPLVSASGKIQMGQSGVSASIVGGSTRTASAINNTIIDASTSMDTDYPGTTASSLSFAWTCSEYIPDFSAACIGFVSTATAKLTIPMGVLKNGKTYNISVTVTNAELKFSVASQLLVVTDSRIPVVRIGAPDVKYNAAEKIILTGAIAAPAGRATATWSSSSIAGFSSTSAVPLTPLVKSFSIGGGTFQLALAANSLTPGLSYTFQLEAVYTNTGNSVSSVNVITVVVNQAPYGGVITALPATGIALTTLFEVRTSLWSDDFADYPLTYTLSTYQQDPGKLVIIKAPDTSMYVQTKLGQGLNSLQYLVYCAVTAADFYGCSANKTTTTFVTPTATNEIAVNAATTSINAALETLDGTAMVVSINAALSSINSVICTVSTPCSTLNRQQCSLSPRTCGSCLTGFSGISGDSNVPCNRLSDLKNVGENCTTASNCISGRCVARKCVDVSKVCVDACSGFGTCVFVNPVGVRIPVCPLTNPTCSAQCVCDSDHYGSNCMYRKAEFQGLVQFREKLCSSIYKTLPLQDSSVSVISARALSISNILVDSQQISDAALGNCTAALVETVRNYPSDACSETCLSLVTGAFAAILGKGSALPSALLTNVYTAVSQLIKGCQSSIVADEAPLGIENSNLRLLTTVVGQDVEGKSYSVPQSAFEKVTKQPTTVFKVDKFPGSKADGSVGLSLFTINSNPRGIDTNASQVAVQLVDYSVGGASRTATRIADSSSSFSTNAAINAAGAGFSILGGGSTAVAGHANKLLFNEISKENLKSNVDYMYVTQYLKMLQFSDVAQEIRGQMDQSQEHEPRKNSAAVAAATTAAATSNGGSFTVVIPNTIALEYIDIPVKVLTLNCFRPFQKDSYFLTDTCPGGTPVRLECPPETKRTYTVNCPAHITSPTCTQFNGLVYAPTHTCTVASFNAYNTTCSCAAVALSTDATRTAASASTSTFASPSNAADDDSSSSNQADSRNTITSFQEYSTVFTSYETLYEESSVDLPSLIEAKNGAAVSAVFSVLVVGYGFGIVFFFMWSTASFVVGDTKKVTESRQQFLKPLRHIRTVNVFFDFIFPDEFRTQPWYRCLAERTLLEHPWLTPFSPGESFLSRVEKWTVLLGDVLVLLFVNCLVAFLMYPDDGECEKIAEKDACKSAESTAGGYYFTQCRWRTDNNSCAYNTPETDFLTTIFVVLIVCWLSSPLNRLWKMCTHHLLCIIRARSAAVAVAIAVEDGDFGDDENSSDMQRKNASSKSTKTSLFNLLSGKNGKPAMGISSDKEGFLTSMFSGRTKKNFSGRAAAGTVGDDDAPLEITLGDEQSHADGMGGEGELALSATDVMAELDATGPTTNRGAGAGAGAPTVNSADLFVKNNKNKDVNKNKEVSLVETINEETKDQEEGNSNSVSVSLGRKGAKYYPSFTRKHDEFKDIVTKKGLLLRAARLWRANTLLDGVSPKEEAQFICDRLDDERVVTEFRTFDQITDLLTLEKMHYRYNIKLESRRVVQRKVAVARMQAENIAAELEHAPDSDSKEVLLMKYFLAHVFSGYQRAVVVKYLFGPYNDSGIGGSSTVSDFPNADYNNHTLRSAFSTGYRLPKFIHIWWRLLCGAALPVFGIAMIYFIFAFNVALGSRSSNLWLAVLFVCLLQKIVFTEPIKVSIVWLCFNGPIAKQAVEVFEHMSNRARFVLRRAHGSAVVKRFHDMVQHFNPACRVARLYPALPVARLLLSVNDNDLRLKPRYTWLQYFAVNLSTLVLSITLLPQIIQDLIIDVIAVALVDFTLIGLHFAYVVSPGLLAACLLILIGTPLYLCRKEIFMLYALFIETFFPDYVSVVPEMTASAGFQEEDFYFTEHKPSPSKWQSPPKTQKIAAMRTSAFSEQYIMKIKNTKHERIVTSRVFKFQHLSEASLMSRRFNRYNLLDRDGLVDMVGQTDGAYADEKHLFQPKKDSSPHRGKHMQSPGGSRGAAGAGGGGDESKFDGFDPQRGSLQSGAGMGSRLFTPSPSRYSAGGTGGGGGSLLLSSLQQQQQQRGGTGRTSRDGRLSVGFDDDIELESVHGGFSRPISPLPGGDSSNNNNFNFNNSSSLVLNGSGYAFANGGVPSPIPGAAPAPGRHLSPFGGGRDEQVLLPVHDLNASSIASNNRSRSSLLYGPAPTSASASAQRWVGTSELAPMRFEEGLLGGPRPYSPNQSLSNNGGSLTAGYATAPTSSFFTRPGGATAGQPPQQQQQQSQFSLSLGSAASARAMIASTGHHSPSLRLTPLQHQQHRRHEAAAAASSSSSSVSPSSRRNYRGGGGGYPGPSSVLSELESEEEEARYQAEQERLRSLPVVVPRPTATARRRHMQRQRFKATATIAGRVRTKAAGAVRNGLSTASGVSLAENDQTAGGSESVVGPARSVSLDDASLSLTLAASNNGLMGGVSGSNATVTAPLPPHVRYTDLPHLGPGAVLSSSQMEEELKAVEATRAEFLSNALAVPKVGINQNSTPAYFVRGKSKTAARRYRSMHAAAAAAASTSNSISGGGGGGDNVGGPGAASADLLLGDQAHQNSESFTGPGRILRAHDANELPSFPLMY
jgi:hypothetical protein